MGEDYLWQGYAVAFLDILGHKEKLRELELALESAKDHSAITGLTAQTAHLVASIRREFHEAIRAQSVFKIEGRPNIPKELLPPLEVKLETFTYGFSDCFLLAVPLGPPTDQFARVVSIYHVFLAAGLMVLKCLANGDPLRGGIEIGFGLRFDHDELYGPVLERAYNLERCVADYPRVVIGSNLSAYLASMRSIEVQAPSDRAIPIITKYCEDAVAMDSDGIPMLHFFGARFVPRSPGLDAGRWFKEAESFGRRFLEECRRRKDSKLEGRYTRLLDYFERHRGPWTAVEEKRGA